MGALPGRARAFACPALKWSNRNVANFYRGAAAGRRENESKCNIGMDSTPGHWLTRRQGRKDLCQLDDRMLADIGISRRDAGISREDAFRKAGGILP